MGMKLLRLDLKGFKKRHGLRLEKLCASTLKELEVEDFVSVSSDAIELTSKGILYGDYVGQTLCEALKAMA